MATIRVEVLRDKDWHPADLLQLVIGTENAASLAASTPAGGTVVAEVRPWEAERRGGFGLGGFGEDAAGLAIGDYGFGEVGFGQGNFGVGEAPPVALEHRYLADDVCAALPIGVRSIDRAGNESSVVEKIIDIADPPAPPAGRIQASQDEAGELTLSWAASPDV